MTTVKPLLNIGHLGDRRKMAIVERFKKESMYGLSAIKWREVTISEGSILMFIIPT